MKMADPGRALVTLAHAAAAVFPTDSGPRTLENATPTQLEQLRQSKIRAPTVKIAKKALKLFEGLEELEAELDDIGLTEPLKKPNGTSRPNGTPRNQKSPSR